jgi:uncharacterized protein YqeY
VTRSDAPLVTLAQGVATSMDIARRSLEHGRRADAVAALDAAMRASDVGQYAERVSDDELFAVAHRAVRRARRAMQNGSPEAARDGLSEVLRPL